MIVGGMIGYITNWLAIKMLFRPHREIKILGIKLPFTPGLIPKERSRIAKSIGDSVGENLLSPEVITNALSKPEMKENINIWIKDNIYRLKENHNSISSILMIQGQEKYRELVQYLNLKIVGFIFSKIKKEDFNSNIVEFAENILYEKYAVEVKAFAYEQMDIVLLGFLNSNKLKSEIELGIQSIIDKIKKDDRTLYEAMPDSIVNSIKTYIEEEQDVITLGIKDILKSPEIQDKLKSSLADLVNQNLNKVVSIFITPELISEKVFIALEKYIDSPEVDETIIYIIEDSVDKVLNHKVSDIGKDILDIISNDKTSIFSDIIIDYISHEEKQSKLLKLIRDKLESEDRAIKEKVLSLISEGIELIINQEEFKRIVTDVVHHTLINILNQPISTIFKDLDTNNIDSITEYLNIGLHELVNNHLPGIVTTMNIASIVEDQINSFDVEFTEELILQIAKKELSAITWVGALLGIIIGLLTPLLQNLY